MTTYRCGLNVKVCLFFQFVVLDSLVFGREPKVFLGFTMQSLLIRFICGFDLFFVFMGFYFVPSLLVIFINRH
jgi:hypothetical protein